MSEKAMTMKKLLTAFNLYLLKVQVLFQNLFVKLLEWIAAVMGDMLFGRRR